MINKESLLALHSSLEAFFIQNGFTRIRGNILDNEACSYRRTKGKSSETIIAQLEVNDQQTVMTASFGAGKRYEGIEQYLDPKDLNSVTFRPDGALTVNLSFEPAKQYHKFPEDEVNKSYDRISSDLIKIVAEKILPILSQYDDIRVLDAKVNASHTESPSIAYMFHWGHKLVISKLAGSPNYDQLEKEILSRFEDSLTQDPQNARSKNYLAVVKRVVDKLKDVPPLSNPIMS